MNNLLEIKNKSDKNWIVFINKKNIYIHIYINKKYKNKYVFMINHFWYASRFELIF